MLNIAILGPGGVGGFLSSVFWKNGIAVTCVGKLEQAEIISRNGIELESKIFGNFIARPLATTSLNVAPDILFITVKATSLIEALKSVKPDILKKNTIVIPLLNGIEHIEVLRKYFGPCVAAATISIEAFQLEPAKIKHTSPFSRIKLASDGDIPVGRLTQISDLLNKCGIETKIGTSEADILWEKLVRLNAIACVTAATDKPIGFLRADSHWRSRIENCVKEAIEVALAEGVNMDLKEVMAFIDKIDPHQFSSMQRDVSGGKECEIDAIAGAIVRAGKRHGIECPTIKWFIDLIKTKLG